MRASMGYKKSYPSKINRDFRARRIDAAFISSVESFRGNFRRFDIGIVAKEKVNSVLVKKGKPKPDPHSATSNALAKVLGIEGEVIIGDKALKLYLENPSRYIDLAEEWHKKEKLPFVFARFCANKHTNYWEKMIKHFHNFHGKIPHYILKKFSNSREITMQDIREYLKLIEYVIDKRASRALKNFQKKQRVTIQHPCKSIEKAASRAGLYAE
jgi:chorismate dehydratase